MTDPLCTCGHHRVNHYWHNDPATSCRICDDCARYAPPGSLEDILGVWADQGPFPLRNTADVKLLVDEIHRLRWQADYSEPVVRRSQDDSRTTHTLEWTRKGRQECSLMADELIEQWIADKNEIERLRARDTRARALLSWINGRCVDEAPHMEIRAAIDRYNEEQP